MEQAKSIKQACLTEQTGHSCEPTRSRDGLCLGCKLPYLTVNQLHHQVTRLSEEREGLTGETVVIWGLI